jgi:hypothetical protein
MSIQEEIEERLKKQIVKENSESFSKRVLQLVKEQEYTFMDAIIEVARQTGYEPDKVTKLLTPEVKARFQEEMEDMNMIKRENNRLPI